MNSAIGGALIGAGASLVDNLFNIGSAERNRELQADLNKENNKFNAEQAQLQRDFAERMYVDYQSPEALRSQYQAAGMNPYLAMSRGAGSVSGGSSAASSAGTPQLQAPHLDLSSFASSFASIAQAIKLSKEASVTEQDYMENWNYLRALGSKAQGDTNWLNRGLSDWKPSVADYKLQQQLYRAQTQGEITRIDLANDMLKSQGTLMRLDADAKRISNKYLDASQQLALARAAQDLRESVARVRNSTRLTDAQLKEIASNVVVNYERMRNIAEQTRGFRLSNKQTEALMYSYIQAAQEGYARDVVSSRFDKNFYSKFQAAVLDELKSRANLNEKQADAVLRNIFNPGVSTGAPFDPRGLFGGSPGRSIR